MVHAHQGHAVHIRSCGCLLLHGTCLCMLHLGSMVYVQLCSCLGSMVRVRMGLSPRTGEDRPGPVSRRGPVSSRVRVRVRVHVRVLHVGGDFGKFKLTVEASWVLQKSTEIQGCQRKTSGISGILGGPPANLYNILTN